MIALRTDRWVLSAGVARGLVVSAHVLALMALGLGLGFVLDTTGGTLFLFSALGPVLVLVAAVLVLVVALERYRARHSLFEVLIYQRGEAIIRQGEEADCAYFVQSGDVEVVRETEGVCEPVARLGAGQYFGEMALLTNERRNATVRAVGEVRVARLGRKNFLSLLQAMPSAQEQILETVKARAMRVGSE